MLPSRDDPVPAGAVHLLGGPPGRRVRWDARRAGRPLLWIVLLTLAVSTLGWVQKNPCRVHSWGEGNSYAYTRVCYTDVYALYYAERLNDDARPYVDHPVEYPPVIGLVMGATAAVAKPLAAAFPGTNEDKTAAIRFFDLSWALLTACAVVVAVATSRTAGRRAWDGALFALAPALVLHGTTNWDLVAVAFASLALLAWARERPVVAGVLLGLGTATKLYPLLFLVPLLALCWRAGRLRAGLATAAATLLATGAVVLPVYLASPAFTVDDQQQVAASPWDRFGDEGFAALAPHVTVDGPDGPVMGINSVYRFYDLNDHRPADWDSLAYVAGQLRGQVGADPWFAERWFADTVDWVLEPGVDQDGRTVYRHLNALNTALLVVVLAGVVALAVGARRRPRLPQLLALTVIGFLLANKVFSPQYVLWVVPLIALARPRWRLFLVWQVSEAVLLVLRFQYFTYLIPGQGGRASPGSKALGWEWFAGAVVVRDLLLVLLAAAIVREVLHPEEDVVRTPVDPGAADDSPDDPAGGVLDGAPDVRGSWVDGPVPPTDRPVVPA